MFPSDDGGCGWYRLRWPAENLAREGHDVAVNPDRGYYRDPTGRDPAYLFLDADVAVVQRITRDIGVEFVQALKDHGHRVVVDVDDDLDSLHDGHPYIPVLSGEGRSPGNLHEVCRMADVVTCTTPALAERYGYGKAVVLPNLVPADYLRVRARRKGRPRVGWTGRPISHVDDWRVLGRLGPPVAEAGGAWAAWGQSARFVHDALGVPSAARVTVPFRPLRSGYPGSVAELTVGVAPLADTVFNRAKSWLKAIEYAALGVPFVASPTPGYEALHGLGAGVLASTPEEWEGAVCHLLGDDRFRRDLTEAGREVARGLTYEAHAGRWWEAWTGMLRQQEPCGGSISEAGGSGPPALVDSL